MRESFVEPVRGVVEAGLRVPAHDAEHHGVDVVVELQHHDESAERNRPPLQIAPECQVERRPQRPDRPGGQPDREQQPGDPDEQERGGERDHAVPGDEDGPPRQQHQHPVGHEHRRLQVEAVDRIEHAAERRHVGPQHAADAEQHGRLHQLAIVPEDGGRRREQQDGGAAQDGLQTERVLHVRDRMLGLARDGARRHLLQTEVHQGFEDDREREDE